MKKKDTRFIFLPLLLLLLVNSACRKNNISSSEKVTLQTDWQFRQVGKEEEWRKAVVPGTVHQDLLNHQLIPDPFNGNNEAQIQWVEQEDWEYQTSFTVTEQQMKREDAFISFEGLDTYADVYLNDSLILRSDNMFVAYGRSVKQILKKGENKLRIYFHSPITQVMPQWEKNGFEYPADNDHSDKHLSVYSRKAPYHFGWDWGIRMVTSGIWRPVYITYYDKARITDFYVNQQQIAANKADILNEITVESLGESNVILTVEAARDNRSYRASKTYTLKKGSNSLILPLEIANPDLWMPNGMGEAALYTFRAILSADDDNTNGTIDEKEQKIGLRTVEVVTEPDSAGESFYFKVNGRPVYAKGANYIPSDISLPRVTSEIYQRIFDDAKQSNMNMLRVWGGGVYEDNRFYEAADEHGILIWQDFMFACTPYPSDDHFLKSVEAEAEYNIKRLRNHASLAMWCGNNEIMEALKYWGLKNANNYTDEIMQGFFDGYDTLFCKLLPEKVRALDNKKYYVHGSPYTANWGRLDLFGIRDAHDWGIWHGRMPFEAFETRRNRFSSEFGFQSFPEMKTISTFADSTDYDILSDVMKTHQKSYIGNEAIKDYMKRYYKVPESFEDFVYVGLVLQGMGIRMGLESQRRNRPYCMGSLYWQLNDCWPVVSWSSIDYYGNWKALQYQAQRAFASPALSVLASKGHDLQCYVLSDEAEPQAAVCKYLLKDFSGNVLKERIDTISVPADSSYCFASCQENEWIDESQRNTAYLQLMLEDMDGNKLADYVHYFCLPKDMQLTLPNTICQKVNVGDGKCIVTLKSDWLLKDLFIEIPMQGARFSDNFFDLLPGEEKNIVITSPQIDRTFDASLIKIHHLRETYP